MMTQACVVAAVVALLFQAPGLEMTPGNGQHFIMR